MITISLFFEVVSKYLKLRLDRISMVAVTEFVGRIMCLHLLWLLGLVLSLDFGIFLLWNLKDLHLTWHKK